MKENDENIAPSMIYAYASLMEGVPFANGAPNLTVDIPAMHELAHEREVPICGKDFKTGQTLMKTVLAPGIQGPPARPERLVSPPTFSATATAKCSTIPGPSRPRKNRSSARSSTFCSPALYPELYGNIYHKVRINYYPPRGDNKEGWDNIDIFGWLGYPMQIKVDFLCRDSILAAPIVLDLVLFLDLAQRCRNCAARHSGVAQLLLQIPDDRAGPVSRARPLHPAHEAEKHAAAFKGRRVARRNRTSEQDNNITYCYPDYAIGWRLDQRAAQTPPPEPLPIPAPLNRLPWELAKDQFGSQGADFIGVMSALMLRAAKDQIRPYLADRSGSSGQTSPFPKKTSSGLPHTESRAGTMQLEFHQLDRRWEHLRVREPQRQRRLLASLADSGQQTPIVVVAAADAGSLPGDRWAQAHRRAGATRPGYGRSYGLGDERSRSAAAVEVAAVQPAGKRAGTRLAAGGDGTALRLCSTNWRAASTAARVGCRGVWRWWSCCRKRSSSKCAKGRSRRKWR